MSEKREPQPATRNKTYFMTNQKPLRETTFAFKMRIVLAIFTTIFLVVACGGPSTRSDTAPVVKKPYLPRMGFSIQVGAFSNIDNAVRLTELLQQRGINAYHFLHSSGLYKVRFANYRTRDAARERGEDLKLQGIIEEYYIVDPQDSAAAEALPDGDAELREAIVTTARRYVGVPYRWGGESPRTGFDCSGLTMVVYRINGLNLPRSSRQQWRAGASIDRQQLQKGDLVFFATRGGSRVSHVGIYTGRDKFLHAPGRGRRIQISSLSSRYYRNRYVGARSYL